MDREPDYRDILLRLIKSLTLSEHMGDVAEDITRALKLARVDVAEWEELSELYEILEEDHGVGGLWDDQGGEDG